MAKKRLDELLVERGLVASPGQALIEIMAGSVLVNEEPSTKAGMPVDVNAVIRLKERFPYVSRGAIKLLRALEHFQLDVKDKVAVDVGSSTGGFTEVLLEKGASKVYCVDSGTNQLEWKIRSDPRVVPMENTSVRSLTPGQFDPRPVFAAVDVSFLPVAKFLVPLIHIMRRPFQAVVLIKPQFELGKDKVGKKGLVGPEHREEAVRSVLDVARSIGLLTGEVIESPITGSKSGNVEYLTVLEGKS